MAKYTPPNDGHGHFIIKAVLFDLGGVLIPSPMEFWTNVLEPSMGLAPGSVQSCLLSSHVLPLFHQLERGHTNLEDFEPIFTFFYNQMNGISRGRIPLFSKHSQWAASSPANGDFSRWTACLQSLRSAGLKVALLTNNFWADRAKRMATLPTGLLASHFDAAVESCRIGMRKPEAAIFEYAIGKLKVHPSEAIFIDDLGSNLKAAQQMGIRTIKCSQTDQCIGELLSLLKLDDANVLNSPSSYRMPTKSEQLPLNALKSYFGTKFPTLKNEQIFVRKFSNGQSNPTYFIRIGDGKAEFVLRKKPPGKLLPSAHRIEREFRVQRALERRIPVPKMVDFVENVLPEPFYLMEFCNGQIFTSQTLPPELKPEMQRQIWLEACRTLAKIHSVQADTVGLADYGKKGEYFKRNLARMQAELAAADGGSGLEGGNEMAKRVMNWLMDNLPDESSTTIVHGDYRLDNLVFSPPSTNGIPPSVLAILDWELSTLGDPLADLANLLFSYFLPQSDPMEAAKTPAGGLFVGIRPTGVNGIPTLEEMVGTYLEARRAAGRAEPREAELLCPPKSGANCPSPLLCFGIVFALLRNAVILAGVFRRFRSGQASNAEAAKQLGRMPEKLLNLAWAMIGRNGGGGDGKEIGVPLCPEWMRPEAFAIYEEVREFIKQEILPREEEMFAWARDEHRRWTVCPIVEELKAKAKSRGLWNLFITRHLDPRNEFGGRRLSTLEYGHICELMGQSPHAPEVFNCSAPDTGNMEVLMQFGTPEQKRRFLVPLLEGKTRSCFAMTEPDVASSDATKIQGSIVVVPGNIAANANDDGQSGTKQHYLLNARKWFITGAAHPNCQLCIFMGQILHPVEGHPPHPRHQRHTMVLVPMPAPGLSIVRRLSVFGNFDEPGGHCELLFENVIVPKENLILGEGRGFEIAQARLGPGRIHHCMRLVGCGERAMALMGERIGWRRVGPDAEPLVKKQQIQLDLAKNRIELEQARMLVLKAAHLIDTKGAKAAAAEIAMIKVVAPRALQRVLDRVMQVFGAAGFTSDWPLALFAVWARTLRIADGPDIVHLETIAKRELMKMSAKI